ncbi:MAG: MFS transporter, partial [Deltaproteobacteria bacterium]|nr:MFS transporter [Deltaproteobacteria bacterium]
LIVISTSFVTPFMGSALNIAIPTIGREFESGATLLSWIATSYILATASCLLPAGRFADLHGRRRIYTAGILVFSLATLLCGLVNSIDWLIFMRVVQGIGASLIFSTGIAILAAVYPPERRGRALGYATASTYIGLSAGPVLGGLISFHLG